MAKFIKTLFLLLAIGGLAVGGFALYKKYASETVTTTSNNSQKSASGEKETSQTSEGIDIGGYRTLLIERNGFIKYSYTIPSENVLKITAKVSISTEYTSLSSSFENYPDVDVDQYVQLSFNQHITSSYTSVTFIIAFKNQIPDQLNVALNSASTTIRPSFSIVPGKEAGHGIDF